MKRLPWREWTVQYAAPTLALVGSLAIMFFFSDDPDMVWIFLIAPAVTFLTAIVVQPVRSWVTPLAVTLLITTTIVVAASLDLVEPRDSLVSMYWWTGLYVGLPLAFFTWLGKMVGVVYRDWRDERRFQAEWRKEHPPSSEGPHAPAH